MSVWVRPVFKRPKVNKMLFLIQVRAAVLEILVFVYRVTFIRENIIIYCELIFCRSGH